MASLTRDTSMDR